MKCLQYIKNDRYQLSLQGDEKAIKYTSYTKHRTRNIVHET